VTYGEAIVQCGAYGAFVPPIVNATMLGWMTGIVGPYSGKRFWNGIRANRTYVQTTPQVWQTQLGRNFTEYFAWDALRSQPGEGNCVIVHILGNISARLPGGNGLMVTVDCGSKAYALCALPRAAPSIGGANNTNSGALLLLYAIRPLQLVFIGANIPANIYVTLQTANAEYNSGIPDFTQTHCQPRLQPLTAERVAVQLFPTTAFGNVSSTDLCGGTCDVATATWPYINATDPPFIRNATYSICFFLPYFFSYPKSQQEFVWDLLPNLAVQPGETRTDFLVDVCTRQEQLLMDVYSGVTDANRPPVNPYYFNSPVQP